MKSNRKRKKPRPFRWWIVVLLVVAAAIVTGILLGLDKEKILKRAPSATNSPGIENGEGPPAQGGGAVEDGTQGLSPGWKIVSPGGRISSSEGYGLSKEGRIISPEGRTLSPEWKLLSPDGQISSPEAYRRSMANPSSSREEQRLSSVEDTEAPLSAPPQREENDCLSVRRDLEDFFTYLDGRDYVQRLKPGIDTRAWFRDMVQTLSSSPPIPGGEGLDFQIMARNIFFFYRILGKNDIQLVLEILNNEREALEMNLDLFFDWSFRKGHCPDPEHFRPDETVLYRYAGFFLNTIGGRSYLSRRSSILRVLITYYSVLIVHERDKNGSNTYGIDPVPYIAPLAKEITMQNNLHFQNEYLQQLSRISNYYTNRR